MILQLGNNKNYGPLNSQTTFEIEIIVPQYMNITTTFSTLKLLFFPFSSCLTIERSIVFKIMDRQCESFSRIFSSATGLDKSIMFIQNTRTSLSINENFQNSKIKNKN